MQVANLLKTGLLNCGINDEKITVATSYEEALETAFTNARAGDFLVIENFYGLKSAELEKLLKKLPREAGTRIGLYPEGYHLLLRDLHAAQPWGDIAAWIGDRARPLPSGADGRNALAFVREPDWQ